MVTAKRHKDNDFLAEIARNFRNAAMQDRNDATLAYQCIHRELAALDDRVSRGQAMTAYQKALHKLLASVALIFDADGVREAGRMLYAVGGHAEMYKALQVWMPKTLHRQIDYAWDGVGEWLC